MSKTDRLSAIRQLEDVRKSRLLTYLTADRGLVNVTVAEDIVRIVYEHLRKMGPVDRLDLFLYSRGGDTNVPWPLVSVARLSAKEFNVLVPYRAYSAATQIAMGADHVVMGPLGELTQVDPSLKTDYTPPNPAQAGQTLFVSVEDLRSYFQFFKEQLAANEASTRAVIDGLLEKIHPLAIGQVQRAHGSIRYIAEALLGTHIKDTEKVQQIAAAMVSEMFVHSHKIKQPEAKRIGLPALVASKEEAEAMWRLFELYEQDLQLATPIRPSSCFPSINDTYVELKDQRMVYVESREKTDVYLMDVLVARTLQSVQQKTVPTAPATAPATPGAPPPTPVESRPIWGPNLTFAVERELWSTE